MPSTHWNTVHKDFTLILSPLCGFVQIEIDDWVRQNNNTIDASQKLMRGYILFKKISLGIKFSLCYRIV
jgi:hypothetical protein